jgi:hypothetical protein
MSKSNKSNGGIAWNVDDLACTDLHEYHPRLKDGKKLWSLYELAERVVIYVESLEHVLDWIFNERKGYRHWVSKIGDSAKGFGRSEMPGLVAGR